MRSSSSVSRGTGPKRSSNRVRKASKQHTLATAGNVGGRQQQFEVALHLALVYELLTADGAVTFQFVGIQVGEFIGFQFVHGFGKYLLIRLIAQVGNEAALLSSQQIAGPTDVEVLHGNVDAAAQVAEVLDGLQAPFGLGREG